MNFNSLDDLKTYFKDEATCRQYLIQQRWPKGILCPFCATRNPYILSTDQYKCRNCLKKFSELHGTVFAYKHLPLTLWFQIIWLYLNENISGYDLGQALNITTKTAYSALLKIRKTHVLYKLNLYDFVVVQEDTRKPLRGIKKIIKKNLVSNSEKKKLEQLKRMAKMFK